MFNFINSFLDKRKRYLGLFLFVDIFLLVLIGCIFVYSSSSIFALMTYKDMNYFFVRQLAFAIVGIIVMFVVSGAVNSHQIRNKFSIIYGVVLFLLVIVHFVGTGAEEWGAKSWIRIGGIGLQPSELGKILGVLTFAYFLEQDKFNLKKYKGMDKSQAIIQVCVNAFLVVLPVILVLCEPDLGTTAIMASGLCFVLFFVVRGVYFVIAGGLGAAGLSVFMLFKAYRMARIRAFINPWEYAQTIGYHIIQSYYAIANGGFFGSGIGNSKQKYMWLPEQHTDFIFSVITEEVGLVGVAIIILLFFIALMICVHMSKNKSSIFEKLSIMGLGSMLIFQAFLNIAVAIGLFPITGVTLPFISYGGSSLIASCLNVGLIIALYQGTQE